MSCFYLVYDGLSVLFFSLPIVFKMYINGNIQRFNTLQMQRNLSRTFPRSISAHILPALPLIPAKSCPISAHFKLFFRIALPCMREKMQDERNISCKKGLTFCRVVVYDVQRREVSHITFDTNTHEPPTQAGVDAGGG